MFYLRLLAAGTAFVAASVYGVAIAVLRRDRGRVAYDYARLLSRWLLPLFRIRLSVHGAERLSAHRPCICIANHQSLLDVPVLAPCYTAGAVVIAKKEVADVPFFGWLYRVTGNLLIDRGDTQQAVGRLREAEEAIRARKVAVWIFPEGTRGTEPGRLLSFKKGAFVMAVHTGAPVVPVVVSPLKPASDIVARRLLPNHVDVHVLEPIPTAGMTDADVPALMREARRRMDAALDALSLARGIAPSAPALPETPRPQ